MKNLDYSKGLGLAIACIIGAIGFYGTLWLMLAIGTMAGY